MSTIHRSNLPLPEMDRGAVMHPMTDLKRYAHGEIAGPRIIESGKGSHIFDRDGHRYLDGFGGLYCVNVGYGRSEVAEAIADQARQLAYYHLYAGNSNEPSIRLADRLVRMAPKGMSKVYFGLSGSGRERDQRQDRLVLQQCPRPAGEEKDHRAPSRLSRRHDHGRQPDRRRGVPQGVRLADRACPAYDCAAPLLGGALRA